MKKEEKEIKIAAYVFTEGKTRYGIPKNLRGKFPTIGDNVVALIKPCVSRLEFTTSLDWIEPVLEKIKKDNLVEAINIYLESEHGSTCQIELKEGLEPSTIYMADKLIDAIVDAILAYIEWKEKQTA